MQKFQNYKGLRQDDRRQACVPGTRQIPWSEYDPLHSPGLLFGQLTGWTVLLLSRALSLKKEKKEKKKNNCFLGNYWASMTPLCFPVLK